MSFKGNYFVQSCRLTCTYYLPDELVSPIKLWRQPDYIDIPKINKMVCPSTRKVFGDISLEELIEMSTVSICMENNLKEVIAYISLKNYPNIYSLDPAVWIEWAQFHYGLNTIQYDNTYFIHLLVWDVRYSYEFLSHFLRTVFLDNGKLEYICLLSLPGNPLNVYMGDQIFQLYFTRISPLTCDPSVLAQNLFICSRSEQLPKLNIRRAVVEDNDDLVEILDSTSKRLRQIYGDYYIAEIILYPQVQRSIVIIEKENFAVGLLCLNSEINMKQLNQHFELGPFHGLRKHLPYETTLQSATEIDNNSLYDAKCNLKRSTKSLNIEYYKEIDEVYKTDAVSIKTESITTNSNQSLTESIFMAFVETSSSDTLFDMVSNQSVRIDNNFIITPKHHDSTITLKTEREYPGDVNVFAIELYGLLNELDDRMVYDLLIAAFETFVDRDYCLIGLPTLRKTFPLLQHFVKLVPRPITTINHDLFVLHRNSIISNISVRLVELEDIDRLITFYYKVQHCKYIIDIIIETLNTNQQGGFQSYLMLNHNNIFGVFVLKDYHDYLYLKTNYDLDFHINYKNHKHCEIKIFYISPIFNTNIFFIFNEIHRLTGYTSFYFFFYDGVLNQENLVTILSDLTPIRPRRRIIYNDNVELLDYIKPDTYRNNDLTQKIFSLYHTNIREFNHLRKHMVNTRIIIVGMSTTSLSFIEELIFNKLSKTFSIANIILVTSHKYSNTIVEHSKDLIELVSSRYHKYNRIYIKKINLKTWINIINGFLTKINRYKKYIVINNRYNIKYDYLYMFCGLEFDLSYKLKMEENYYLPSNIFLINSILDAELMYVKLKDALKIKSAYNIIVYGDTLEAYCCIHYLLTIGIKPSCIIFIKPPLDKKNEFHVPVFNDEFVESEIQRTLIELNIIILDNCKLIGWELNDKNDARKVHFESPYLVKSIECLYCFIYEAKMVNGKLIKALNRAGLVFDGRLVIDNDYQTNDPFIFAAGPFTKYRRILYAEKYRHEYYNSEEIGMKLARLLINKVDPTKPYNNKSPPKDFPLSVPHYKKPIVISCRLPGNYNYLYIRAPGFPVPHSAAKALENYGVDLFTGHPTLTIDHVLNVSSPYHSVFKETEKEEKINYKYTKKDCENIGYFRLHLNQYNFVHTIVCLTKNQIDKTNLIELWGKHEKLLNNLLTRYKMNIIDDFYEFFRHEWACALYHDRFNMLTKLSHKLIFNNLYNDDYDQYKILNCITDKIIMNNWEKLSIYQRQEFMAHYSFSKYQKLVEKNLLKFLHEYYEELPMYAEPENLQKLLH